MSPMTATSFEAQSSCCIAMVAKRQWRARTWRLLGRGSRTRIDGKMMGTKEIYEQRARQADERAASAATPKERKIWNEIAAEYRVFARQDEADRARLRPIN
jgi:hypothetical protein